jgi:hypothetical protein
MVSHERRSLGLSLGAATKLVALHFLYYNLGRIHKTLRVTPAIEAGLTDHIWSLEESRR